MERICNKYFLKQWLEGSFFCCFSGALSLLIHQQFLLKLTTVVILVIMEEDVSTLT